MTCRFSFGHYNESFQGHYVHHNYCSWALVNGDTKSVNPEQYQASREDMNLEDEKFLNLTSRIRAVRAFGREYLSSTSILSILPTGINTKDFDLIVEVTRRSEDGYRVSNGKEELVLNTVIPSYATEGSIAKLRSVARIDTIGKEKVIVPNNFTSLINIPTWTQDSETFRKNYTAMDVEDDSIYTSLAQLNSMPLSIISITKMNAKTRNIM